MMEQMIPQLGNVGQEVFHINTTIVEADKVTLASFYLAGDAQLWYYMVENELLYVTYMGGF